MAVNQKSRSGIFLIELSIIIIVFALCAAIALRALSVAETELSYSENLTEAKSISAHIAESYKSGNSPEEMTDIGSFKNGVITVRASDKVFLASLSEREGEDGVSYLDIEVSDENRSYLSITCARRNSYEP